MVGLNKWLALVLAFAAILAVSGCVKVQMRENIDSSGNSDFSMAIEAINVTALGWDKRNPCDTFNSTSSSPLFTDAKCRFDGKTETVSGKFQRKKAGGLTITGTKYRFDLIDALSAFNDKKEKDSATMKLQEKKNATLVKQYKDAGIRYDYVVKMPGKVTGHSGCELKIDGTCTFDLLELEAKDNPYVESDAGMIGALLGGSSDKEAKKTTATTPSKGGKNSNSPICCIPGITVLFAALGAAATKLF